MTKEKNLFFKNFDKETNIVKSVSNGTKTIVGVVAAGLAIGLGLKAFSSVS